MKILRSWLAEYVDLPEDSDEIAETLTRIGLTVDAVIELGRPVEGVVAARVLRTERHPDANKVHRVFVDTGDGIERHVWCGAFNMEPGDIVPLATLGTTMPDGRQIERRGILGIDSEGMLCSSHELGLGDDHSGIMILPAHTEPGLRYSDALGIEPDVLFEIDLTRNRPDCWGYVGVARDLAAALGTGFRPPAPDPEPFGDLHSAPVEIRAGDRCGRFTSTVISGVAVGPSAPWMARRLEAAGMRSINNVVDVSNYVMLELNQPNHAYDLDTLGGGGFIIRTASDGETMVTLDGVERRLDPDDLLICDGEDRPIGLAGVMGGLDSEITDSTVNVALEMAWFETGGVMRAVNRHGLRSEASARNERGIDPFGIDRSIARFVELLRETCPDLVHHSGVADERAAALPAAARSTTLSVSEIQRVLGITLGSSELRALLDPIGFGIDEIDAGLYRVDLPSWRPDCTSEIDVIEEVARMFGYDRLGRALPTSTVHGHLTAPQQRRRLLRQVLLGLGISEVMPTPFLAPEAAARTGLDPAAIRLVNPLVSEESVLRTSLRPGLLDTVVFNASHRRPGIRVFEIGHVYPPSDDVLPAEYESLGVVLAGAESPEAVGVWREIAAALGIGARLDQSVVPAGLHPTRSATLSSGSRVIGSVGEIAPDVLEAYGISERVAIVELDLDQVLTAVPEPARLVDVSRSPSSDLDLAFIVPESVTADQISRAVRRAAGSILVELELFDVYRGPSIAAGSRSLAYRLRLQAADRTLTDDDISRVVDACAAAGAELGAELRR